MRNRTLALRFGDDGVGYVRVDRRRVIHDVGIVLAGDSTLQSPLSFQA